MVIIFDSKFASDKAPAAGFSLTVSGLGQGIHYKIPIQSA